MAQREEEKAAFVRRHYESLGYRVHSGLQFGVDFVLYADAPDAVHSDFCVHIVCDGEFSWTHLEQMRGQTELSCPYPKLHIFVYTHI
jgi:tRNA splicing endonuclease